jgi:mannose-6-phosphate isomerase-like protein (cupin superfamily)
MAKSPVIRMAGEAQNLEDATGKSFVLREWAGSGPAELHIHRDDDEAWHVLSGVLRFRFADSEVDAPAGSTVFVPAGVAHTFEARTPDTRYLLVLTERLLSLIKNLSGSQARERKSEIYRAHASELVDPAGEPIAD